MVMDSDELRAMAERAVEGLSLQVAQRLASMSPQRIPLCLPAEDEWRVTLSDVHALRRLVHLACWARVEDALLTPVP